MHTLHFVCPYLLLDFGNAQNLLPLPGSQLFQCQSSTNQSGQIFTPNIPDLYFDASTIWSNRDNFTQDVPETGLTHIYTIPTDSEGHNCSGTAVAIQYCFETNFTNVMRSSFDFLILDQEELQLEFTVSRRIQLGPSIINLCSTVSTDVLTCCTTEDLSSAEQFQISSSPFTFGILPRFALLYSIPTENSVRQYEAMVANSGAPNTTFTATSAESNSLLMMRLIIGKYIQRLFACLLGGNKQLATGQFIPLHFFQSKLTLARHYVQEIFINLARHYVQEIFINLARHYVQEIFINLARHYVQEILSSIAAGIILGTTVLPSLGYIQPNLIYTSVYVRQ